MFGMKNALYKFQLLLLLFILYFYKFLTLGVEVGYDELAAKCRHVVKS